MNKKTFQNLMIAVIAAILLIVSYLGKEEFSPISLFPLILLSLIGKLFYKAEKTIITEKCLEADTEVCTKT